MRRQPSGADMHNVYAQPSGSAIPVPATATKRRADPPPTSAQPPHNRMRMSIAGGQGPSRPLQQSLAPPAPQYAPRASTYGAGPSSQNNPLLMSARKDTNQFGRTPLRGVTPNARRQGFLSGSWSIPKETRPTRDRQYQALMQREILDYLNDARCAIPNLSPKTLQAPTNREFHLLFQFLITDLDETYVFGREKKPEDEIILLLRDLRYPLVDTISKTALAAPGSSSAWPVLLPMLHWLVTTAIELHKWNDPEVAQDYSLVPANEIPLDVEIPNFAELITCDYIFNAYAQYMYGSDDFREQDLELEGLVDRKNEAIIQRNDEAEIRIAKLKADIAKLNANPSELERLNEEYERCQADMRRIPPQMEQHESKIQKANAAIDLLNTNLVEIQSQIDELNREHQEIQKTIAAQGLSPDEIQHMNSERDNLKRTLEDLLPKSANALRTLESLEIAFGKKADIVDSVVTRYNKLLFSTNLAPTAPEPYDDINFQVELNTGVANPQDMLKTDIRGVVQPSLTAIVKQTRDSRADAETKKLMADDELETLTQQCDTMMENQDPKMNQLQILNKMTEELRNTVAAETAVANAEVGKLERDLAQIETSAQQSGIALSSRRQRLQLEFADVKRNTELLKEETKKKITSQCNQLLSFKQDVTKELEGLVLFSREN